jgi:prepilin-type N-terminal cleavage/methylation domain-containing protein
MTRLHQTRRGFTLIELLVVMAIITALGLLALMLLPGVTNSDAALKATEEVRATGKIAQALAAGARAPRGVRFLVPPGAPLGSRYATELQLVEAPPVTVLDPLTLSFPSQGSGAADAARLATCPYVEITYELYQGPDPNTGQNRDPSIDPNQPTVVPPQGAIKRRHCRIFSLTLDQANQVKTGALLALPTLNFWSRIQSATQTASTTVPNRSDVEAVLDVYPDTYMGASTYFRTYHAGIYGPPVPLLGQPTIPLPNKTGVDLDLSVPPIVDPLVVPAPALPDYDIMFAPDGQTISAVGRSSNAGVYLWVRDVTKLVNTNPLAPNTSLVRSQFLSPAAWADGFRRGGEQHVVGINNGFIGTAPVQWPDATGAFPNGTDAFTFARKRMN